MTREDQRRTLSKQSADHLMARALRLARRARGKTWPNPMVGSLVARRGRILGEGYHHKAGLAHAEIEALQRAGVRARGADLFVTLEPCHRTGRTGPCTEAIQAAGIRRVFVGTRDPNPQESGRGLRVLRRMGIEVIEGIHEEACRTLNEVYNVFIRAVRPFVLVKAAASLDGRLAVRSGDARWVSGTQSRRLAHRLRARAGAVLVGIGTVLADNPRLDVRHVTGRNPAVAILDAKLRMSARASLLSIDRGAPVWIYCSGRADPVRMRRLRSAGAEIVPVASRRGRLDLNAVLQDLYRRGVYQLLVEGGATVIGSLMKARLVDRLEVFLAPRVLGSDGVPLADFAGPARVQAAPRLERVTWRRVGADMCCSGRVVFGAERG